MIDHLGITVSDLARSKLFYTAALAPLGYEVIMEMAEFAGLGQAGKPDFWIAESAEAPTAVHVALLAPDRATVDAFYQAAVAAGGRDNGAPGPRTIYHPNYYGAFVLDPDGHNIEAVCHSAPAS
jgi:catechol 2,3-dioxygenase-like lactoylglutathione lyase family enzyme